VADLARRHRPAGRLALLTAMASYRVTASLVDEFRQLQPADAALIELTAWASMAAARREGTLLLDRLAESGDRAPWPCPDPR